MRKLALVIIFVALLLVGCVNQDLSKCSSPVVVKFDYSYNESGTNRVVTDVTRMSLYVFDSEGVLVDFWRVEGEAFIDHMSIDLKPGKYSFVAWGGEQNCECYSVEPIEKGVTTYEQMRLALNTRSGVVDTKPYNLFFGSLGETQIKQGANSAVINLIRNSKNVSVRVKGLDVLLPTTPAEGDNSALDRFEVRISGDNACYRFDNTLDISNSTRAEVLYLPYRREATHQNVECDFRVMRLARQAARTRAVTDNQIDLQIFDRQTQVVVKTYDLIDEIITQHPLIQPDPTAGLDRYSDYLIEIVYSADGKCNVYLEIMDWKVRIVTLDLD